MIHFSSSIVLANFYGEDAGKPTFMWENYVDYSGITAQYEDDNNPATNLANPQTSSYWKSTSLASQTLLFDILPEKQVDAVCIARHNFGSGAIGIKIEGITADVGATWQTLIELDPSSDAPLMAIFQSDFYIQVRITLTPTDVFPQAAVMYIGPMLRMMLEIPPGYQLGTDARDIEIASGISESGEFLGDIIIGQTLDAPVEFKLLDPLWYRAQMRPFLFARVPFFFAWAPLIFPDEVLFGKFNGNTKPVVNQVTGEIDISLPIIALAL